MSHGRSFAPLPSIEQTNPEPPHYGARRICAAEFDRVFFGETPDRSPYDVANSN